MAASRASHGLRVCHTGTMVLHLLGKKSWNVYNTDNVERVRRDEAEAKAREEAAEQRMQEEDAQRRIALLRGEEVPPLVAEDVEQLKEADWRSGSGKKDDDTYDRRDRKRRKLRGEDDTDRDMRYARRETDSDRRATHEILKKTGKDAPLQDHAGNIQLFPAPDEKAIRATQKNDEAEAEKAKKRKREEDQVTMRFSNAAGYQNGMQKPWYADVSKPSSEKTGPTVSRNDLMLAELKGKDVWGNEDPRRKEREQNRISSNDPFAAMQHAQRQLKQSEKDKEAWQKRQQAELEALKREQRREKESRRRHVEDGLDSFSLDAPAEKKRDRDGSRHRRHRHHRRSRSREREHRRRDRSRSRSRERESRRHHHRNRSHD